MAGHQGGRPDRVQQAREHVDRMRQAGIAKSTAEIERQAREARNGA